MNTLYAAPTAFEARGYASSCIVNLVPHVVYFLAFPFACNLEKHIGKIHRRIHAGNSLPCSATDTERASPNILVSQCVVSSCRRTKFFKEA